MLTYYLFIYYLPRQHPLASVRDGGRRRGRQEQRVRPRGLLGLVQPRGLISTTLGPRDRGHGELEAASLAPNGKDLYGQSHWIITPTNQIGTYVGLIPH